MIHDSVSFEQQEHRKNRLNGLRATVGWERFSAPNRFFPRLSVSFTMNESERGGEKAMKLLLKRYAWWLVAGWTIASFLLVAIVVWNEWRQAAETALTEARSSIQSNLIYWHW